jgi:general nucleoside transport system ATP-binding protein
MEHDHTGQPALVHFVTEAPRSADVPTVGTSAASAAVPRIRIRGLTKAYGPVVANDSIDLDIARGGIHAIVGENGAGKTTLVRAIYGLVEPDAGSIELDGNTVNLATPARAIANRIGMVHQRFQLVEPLTALENLTLGDLPHRGLFFDRPTALSRARALAAELGTTMEWDRPVVHLSVGARQRLEIMRLLYRKADILIFDEPTSVLTPQEADDLFRVLRRLASQGRTIIFITHKLREVFALAERVTVMRRGRVITTVATKGSDPQALASLIVGEQFERPELHEPAERGDAVIEVEGLSVCDDLGSVSLREASFAIHAGEIVGLAGIEGGGQRELVEALLGLRNPVGGSIRLHGRPVAGTSVWGRRKRGIAFISEDRDGEGACLPATLAENVFPLERYDPELTHGGRLRTSAITAFARSVLTRFNVRGAGPHSPARSLSGGNLQRLVLGREIGKTPRLLLASHPTRGVDVRGIAFIHEQLTRARSAGAATLLISEELSELIELSDRLLVIFEGRIVADLPAAQATAERLGLLMTGAA